MQQQQHAAQTRVVASLAHLCLLDDSPLTMTLDDSSPERARSPILTASTEEIPDPAATPGGALTKQRVRQRLFATVYQPIRIGRFTLLEQIGAGATGEVFAAYDERLNRKVALKLLRSRAGAASPRDRARMVREAKVLAQLSHPNVVQVYDVGEHDGAVFVAMEFIAGHTLEGWLNDPTSDTHADWRAVVERFLDAGRGLQAAHQAGLMHRDFKPENALVGEDGRVRVVDFGLARLVPSDDSDDSDESERSGEHAETDAFAPRGPLATVTVNNAIVGTPAYMSPEQMCGGPVDARTDQFSFCVALYEALYGVRPYAGQDLRALEGAIARAEIAEPAAGTAVPRAVRTALVRGLSPDPDDRFADMGPLLDVLSGAVARRRIGAVVAGGLGALVSAALVFGLASGEPADRCAAAGAAVDELWNPAIAAGVRAELASVTAPFAAAIAERAVSSLDMYAGRLREQTVSACVDTRVRGHQSERQLGLRNLCLQRGARALRALRASFADADAGVVERAIAAIEHLPAPEACADVEALTLGVQPPPPTLAVRVAALRQDIARARAEAGAGRFARGAEIAERAVRDARELDYPPALAEALFEAGRLRMQRDPSADAREVLLDSVDLAEAHRHDDLAADVWTFLTRTAVNQLEDPAAAARWSRRARAALDKVSARGARRAEFLDGLGRLYTARGDLVRGEAHHRQALAALGAADTTGALGAADTTAALGAADTTAAPVLRARLQNGLAINLEAQGSYRAAADMYREAIAGLERHLDPRHPLVASAQYNLGTLLLGQGELAAARERIWIALDIWTAIHGADHLEIGRAHQALAALELAADDTDAALVHARRAEEVNARVLPASHPARANASIAVAVVHQRRGEPEQALAAFRRALDAQSRALPAGNPGKVKQTQLYIADGLRELGRTDEALGALAEAERELGRAAEPDAGLRARLHIIRGELRLDRGELAAAQGDVERALRIHRDAPLAATPLADARWILAQTLVRRGREPCRARELARAAAAGYADPSVAAHAQRERVLAWLERVDRVDRLNRGAGDRCADDGP